MCDYQHSIKVAWEYTKLQADYEHYEQLHTSTVVLSTIYVDLRSATHNNACFT